MRQLEEAGYDVTHDAEKPKGEIAVINTCGFIGDAKEESINMILEFAQEKEEGNLEKLFKNLIELVFKFRIFAFLNQQRFFGGCMLVHITSVFYLCSTMQTVPPLF